MMIIVTAAVPRAEAVEIGTITAEAAAEQPADPQAEATERTAAEAAAERTAAMRKILTEAAQTRLTYRIRTTLWEETATRSDMWNDNLRK